MNYIYEKNIVEIKQEYTTFLTNILTPFIYEGIKSVYTYAQGAHKEFLERGKYDYEVKSPGILKIFQISLKEIPTLNNNTIEIETNRIKSGSKCAEWFDSLVKATIKSHIVLLTFTNPVKIPDLLKEDYHEKIEVKDFIHKCYIESARTIYNNAELFWHEYPSIDIQRNQRETFEIIKLSIQEAIRKMLPMDQILKEYLNGNYADIELNNQSQYENIKELIENERKAYEKLKGEREGGKHEVEEETGSITTTSSTATTSSNSRDSVYVQQSSESSSGTDSSDTTSEEDAQDDYNKTKNFLKDIESQLQVLDNTINNVSKVKDVQPVAKKDKDVQPVAKKDKDVQQVVKDNDDGDALKELNNLFEKQSELSKNGEVNDKKISEIPLPVLPVVSDPPKEQLPEPQIKQEQTGGKKSDKIYDIDKFVKPKKPSKRNKLLFEEMMEEKINNKL